MQAKTIPDTSGLVKKTDYNAKISEIEGKIPSISDLATNVALTVVENKTPEVSNLVKENQWIEKKITNHRHDKYITTLEFNKLTTEHFPARSRQANLETKNDIANSVNKTDFDKKLKTFNKKITSNKTKHLLVEIS